jgi:hypothetical protein
MAIIDTVRFYPIKAAVRGKNAAGTGNLSDDGPTWHLRHAFMASGNAHNDPNEKRTRSKLPH